MVLHGFWYRRLHPGYLLSRQRKRMSAERCTQFSMYGTTNRHRCIQGLSYIRDKARAYRRKLLLAGLFPRRQFGKYRPFRNWWWGNVPWAGRIPSGWRRLALWNNALFYGHWHLRSLRLPVFFIFKRVFFRFFFSLKLLFVKLIVFSF